MKCQACAKNALPWQRRARDVVGSRGNGTPHGDHDADPLRERPWFAVLVLAAANVLPKHVATAPSLAR